MEIDGPEEPSEDFADLSSADLHPHTGHVVDPFFQEQVFVDSSTVSMEAVSVGKGVSRPTKKGLWHGNSKSNDKRGLTKQEARMQDWKLRKKLKYQIQ